MNSQNSEPVKVKHVYQAKFVVLTLSTVKVSTQRFWSTTNEPASGNFLSERLNFWFGNIADHTFNLAVDQLRLATGLPDGIFSDQKCQFWYILEGLGMDNFGVFAAL
jgi:hypothetical protein